MTGRSQAQPLGVWPSPRPTRQDHGRTPPPYMRRTGHLGEVPLAQVVHAITEGWRVTVQSIGGHPAKRQRATLQRSLQQVQSQTWLRLEHHVLGHAALFAAVGMVVIKPGFGQKQATVGQGIALPADVAQIHADLAVGAALQFLLADSVRLILAELQAQHAPPIDCVSLDTKHILAWVTENNPKTYVADRFNKHKQPAGDPDCRLGCKRRHNRPASPGTPTGLPVSGRQAKVGEYYWGYGSGVVVAKIPDFGELVIAELTQTFDHADVTYFFPLMQQTEERLGYRPRYATFDAAFDAWYVYAYFYHENNPDYGFAAVPFSEKGNYKAKQRQFAPNGWPLCAAGLTMPLKFTYTDRTTAIIEHERGKYVCPLTAAAPARQVCPVRHPNWKKGGCTAMMPTSIGARLRHTLDRDSELYKQMYRQRTAVERINAQAVALGIERPHLRNGSAIANQNTLIYLLINLRFLHRLREGRTENA